MKKLVPFVVFLIMSASGLKAQQYYKVSGYVADSSRAPIPDVNIFIANGPLMGTTDEYGYFTFELGVGQYELVFNHTVYQQTRIHVVIEKGNDTINVLLLPLITEMHNIIISKTRKDPGPEMMRKAIERKDFWAKRLPPNSSKLYVRAFEEYQKNKPKKNEWENEKVITEDSTAKKKKKKGEDNGPGMNNMAEIVLTRDWAPPSKIKEVREAVSIHGSAAGLFYVTTLDGDFNFYTNLVKIPALSEMPVMSPLSNTALLAYKFNYLGSYYTKDHKKILKIKMQPRQLSNSVFTGEIHLYDSLFCIYRVDLQFPQNILNEYDRFNVAQEYVITADSHWYLSMQRFDYWAKAGKGKFNGYTLVNYKSTELFKTFPKNHFGLELSATEKEAYEKDSAYWNKERTSPLSQKERVFITRTDSVKRVLNSDKYKDSIEKLDNKLTWKKLLFFGPEYHNHRKGLDMQFTPLVFIAQPWMPGGWRINIWNSVRKEFKNKKNIYFSENLSYGLNNKDLQGNVELSHLYNPYKQGFVYFNIGRNFQLINNNAAIVDVFKRNNYYQNTHGTVYHRMEILNGLFLKVQAEFAERKDLSKFTYDKVSDNIFDEQHPTAFKTNRALYSDITVSYTPFQKYIREPKRKLILGSRWPTFSVNYRKAIPGVFNSNVDYDYLEYRIDHEFPIGLMGNSELRMLSGSFARVNMNTISPVDYRYQRRGDIYFLTPPMYNFQQLDSTFKTFKRFYELHYRHHFNGALLNKIPFAKKLMMRETAGFSALYAPERRNMLFYETYFGLDKMVRIWRERLIIGLYYSIGYSNLFEKPRTGFKFNIQFYNRRTNKW